MKRQMIDDKSLEIYRQIQAPDSLKEKVLVFEESENRRKPTKMDFIIQFRPLMGVAACLVFIVVMAVVFSNKQPYIGIYVAGEKVGNSPVNAMTETEPEIATVRMVNEWIIPIEVESKQVITMSVTTGSLTVTDKDGEIATENDEVEKQKDQTVQWVLDAQEAELPAELIVEYAGYQLTYQLYQDETSEQYYMTLKEKVRTK